MHIKTFSNPRKIILRALFPVCAGAVLLGVHGGIAIADDGWDEYKHKINKEYCERPEDGTHTLLLVDKTDALTEEQIAYIKDNYLHEHLQWSNKGDSLSLVLMSGEKPSLLPVEKICAPVKRACSGFGDWWDGCQSKHGEDLRRDFRNRVSGHFLELIKKGGGAPQSHLIESLAELTQNKKFNFDSAWHKRKLLFVTELYQHSPKCSFFPNGKCLAVDGKVLAGSKKYVENFFAKFKDGDEVEIYHFNLRNRNPERAETFWKWYFGQSGIQVSRKENYDVIREKNPSN